MAKPSLKIKDTVLLRVLLCLKLLFIDQAQALFSDYSYLSTDYCGKLEFDLLDVYRRTDPNYL